VQPVADIHELVEFLDIRYIILATAFCADGTAASIAGVYTDGAVYSEKGSGFELFAAGTPWHDIRQE
jgi:hypothetical protein